MSEENKTFIRKVEYYSAQDVGPAVLVPVEILQKCNPPYTGSSEEELMDYIHEHELWCECSDWETNNQDMIEESDDLCEFLSAMQYPEMEFYDDSKSKGEHLALELGINPETSYFQAKVERDIQSFY